MFSSKTSVFEIIGRKKQLFESEIKKREKEILEVIRGSKILVIGGAGSIGQAVCNELYKRYPKEMHVVDISENNLVELVRDLRSQDLEYFSPLRTFAIDFASKEFEMMLAEHSPYDYVFNLSAMKHVRSEKDPYTLMRMLNVNIFNTVNSINLLQDHDIKKYFYVSTDKATNPVNLMGASKRVAEMYLCQLSEQINISSSRFANVAFSDGSLLHGFENRIKKRQPMSLPLDVKRYFITQEEAGQLCLLSAIFGENRDIFFPKMDDELELTSFNDICTRFLNKNGFEAMYFDDENEARKKMHLIEAEKKYPVHIFKSDTSGEKKFEEFYSNNDVLGISDFENIGIVKMPPLRENMKLKLKNFEEEIEKIKASDVWQKSQIVNQISNLLPSFKHIETGKNLDQRM